MPMEAGLPYALFFEDTRISDLFATKAEAWIHAETAGLVKIVPAHDEDPPRRVLGHSHSIRDVDAEGRRAA